VLSPLARGADCAETSVGFAPLTDLGAGLYLDQFAGGLYAMGAVAPPLALRADTGAAAVDIGPLSAAGAPDPGGKYVFLSIGLSNTTQEFGAFLNLIQNDSRVRTGGQIVLDGAASGQHTATWDNPADANYDRVRDTVLAPAGVTEAQVVAVWVKLANPRPVVALPDAGADAFTLEAGLGNVARALRIRYPNLQLAFFSSRIYAGYSVTNLNPEPYAYESGFAVKWLIEAQQTQVATNAIDAIAGNLLPGAQAPLLLWGPYLWADGLIPNAGGVTWRCADLANDGTHPSATGREKVASLLLEFLLRSPASSPWFSTLPSGDVDLDGAVGPGDLLTMLAAWGSCGAKQLCAGDVNGDGVTGPGDLLTLLANWGSGP